MPPLVHYYVDVFRLQRSAHASSGRRVVQHKILKQRSSHRSSIRGGLCLAVGSILTSMQPTITSHPKATVSVRVRSNSRNVIREREHFPLFGVCCHCCYYWTPPVWVGPIYPHALAFRQIRFVAFRAFCWKFDGGFTTKRVCTVPFHTEELYCFSYCLFCHPIVFFFLQKVFGRPFVDG